MAPLSQKEALKQWKELCATIQNMSTVDAGESLSSQSARMDRARKDYAFFVEYYFPHYCTNRETEEIIPSAKFHIEGKTHIKNIVDNTWSGTTLPWMSIGYEVRMTPLNLLTFYNAVANNGTMVRPMFVEGIMEHGEIVEKMKPKVLRSSICSRRTIKNVQSLLKGV